VEGPAVFLHPTKAGCPIQAVLWLEWDNTAFDEPFLSLGANAGFPTTLHWTQPRVRFSVGENRMKSANAIKINRKSGCARDDKGRAVLPCGIG
jgi:hypothetical protein